MGFWDFVKGLLRVAVAAWWNKVTEGGIPGTEPNYVVEYPEEYTKEYFQNGFSDYRWNPTYKAPLNNLYDNNERFKYRSPKNYKR